jgi:hypothetical protein
MFHRLAEILMLNASTALEARRRMKFILFVLGIFAATTVLITPSNAQNYGARITVVEGPAAVQIAASQHLNNAWKPRAGSAACANRTRNISLRPDRIHR